MSGVREIAIDRLRVSKVNPRRSPGDVDELAASIRLLGVIEPVIVVPDGDSKFVVLAGSRRLAAATEAGLEQIPAVVREDLTEEQREILMLSENVHRSDLSHLEVATVYARLMKLFGLNQAQVADRTGMSSSHVSQHLAFLRLPKRVVEEVETGEKTFEEALQIGRHRGMNPAPTAPPRGLAVSLHQMAGHEKCKSTCEVRALADQLSG